MVVLECTFLKEFQQTIIQKLKITDNNCVQYYKTSWHFLTMVLNAALSESYIILFDPPIFSKTLAYFCLEIIKGLPQWALMPLWPTI